MNLTSKVVLLILVVLSSGCMPLHSDTDRNMSGDRAYFESYNNNVRIFHKARIYFYYLEYEQAIPYYEKLIGMYKSGELQIKDQILTIINNLGVSYRKTNQVAKAEKMFNYGTEVNSDYPLFYYNLAIIEATRNELHAALTNLQKAIDNKDHLLAYDLWPDPRIDDNFKPYYGDDSFVAFFQINNW